MGKGQIKLIDFIYFDLGNVLVRVDKNIVANNLDPYSGLKRKRIYRIFSCDYAVDQQYEFWKVVGEFDRGNLHPDQFYGKVCRALHLEKLSFKRFVKIWKMMLEVDSGMVELIKDLRQKNGIRTGIISDLCVLHYNAVMARLSRDLFDIPPFYSFMERCLKRENDGITFKRAIRAANLPADRILFIDDREPNLEAAAKWGMRTFHYTLNFNDLLQYLKDAGLGRGRYYD